MTSNSMRGGWLRALVAIAVLAGPITVRAGETLDDKPDRVDEFLTQHNLHGASLKLGRGLGNLFAGWMEIPINLEKRYTERDAPTAIFTGLAYGTVKAVARTAVGAYETLTFCVPYPEEYAPIMPPLEYFRNNEDDEHSTF